MQVLQAFNLVLAGDTHTHRQTERANQSQGSDSENNNNNNNGEETLQSVEIKLCGVGQWEEPGVGGAPAACQCVEAAVITR